MRVRDAMQDEVCLEYEESEELILCRGVEGVSLEVDATDPDPREVINLRIAAISVFASEIMTSRGQRGDW